jgi:2-haloacid dehalogenase
MPELRLTDIDAIVFDAYGTLFDYASAAERCKAQLGADWQRFSDTWRRKQLEYTWLRSLMGRHTDFWQVTSESLDFAMATINRQDPSLRALLMQQYLNLDAFPDAIAALKFFKGAGTKVAILSNGTQSMLAAAVNSAKLSRLLDHVLSVESVKTFKPHPSVYQLVVDQMKVTATRVCFVSSNGWDAIGAAAFGFRAVWVNRMKLPADELSVHPEAQLSTLTDLVAMFQHA